MKLILLILLILSEAFSLPAFAVPLAVGWPAAPFTLADVQARRRTLAEFHGRPVVLCFFCGCAACHRFAREWAGLQRSGALAADAFDTQVRRPVTIVLFTGTAAEARAFARDTDLERTQTVVLPDPSGRVTRSYDAILCPRIAIIDARGMVRYFNHHPDDAPPKAPDAAIVADVLNALHHNTPPSISNRQTYTVAPPAKTSALIVVPQPGLMPRSDGVRYDLGFIDRLAAPKTERTLKLRNAGQADIVIERLQSSCPCVTAELASEGQPSAGCTLRPGQEIELHIALDVSQLAPGPVQKFVWILRRGMSTPALTVELNATTEAAIQFTPDVLDFGRCRAGAPRSLTFTVAIDRRLVTGGIPLELACTNPNVTVVAQETDESRQSAVGESGGRSVVRAYTAVLSQQAAIGVLSGTIALTSYASPVGDGETKVPGLEVRTTLADLLKSVSVPIRGEVIGEITASPGAVRFDVVHPGKDPPRRITLTGAAEAALRGLRVSSEAQWLSVRLLARTPKSSPTVLVLEVSVTSKAPAGPIQAEIVITTTGGKRLVLPVSGYVVPARAP